MLCVRRRSGVRLGRVILSAIGFFKSREVSLEYCIWFTAKDGLRRQMPSFRKCNLPGIGHFYFLVLCGCYQLYRKGWPGNCYACRGGQCKLRVRWRCNGMASSLWIGRRKLFRKSVFLSRNIVDPVGCATEPGKCDRLI